VARSAKQPKKASVGANYPSEEQLFSDFKTYCEYLLWVRNKKGNLVPFIWNIVQQRLHDRLQFETARGNPHRLVLKYRRAGITTYFQARSFFLTANQENKSAVTLAHDNQSTEMIFQIALQYYKKLEDWARPYRKTENKRELDFSRLGSMFYIGTAGGEAFGRGQTLQRVHGSEVAFWPKGTDHAVLVAGLLEAASHGEVDFETTANGHGNWFHKAWTGAKNNENAWVPIFLSWKDDPELVVKTDRTLEELGLSTQEEELVKAYLLRPEQILWRRMKMKELYHPDLGHAMFHQEYPINDVEAFISSGSCFFDTEIIQHLTNLCAEPIETADSGRLKIYEKPKSYRLYSISADIGEGVKDGDRTIITVMDTYSCEEVACWTGITSPEDCARKMADLADLYNGALVAPEANGFGHSTINTLLNEIGWPSIYQHTDYQAVRIVKDGMEVTPKYGWQTNQKTRPLMLAELRSAIQGGLYKVNDKEFFNECLTFCDNGHGKYEASNGAKDDRVLAHAINWQVRNKQVDLANVEQLAIDTGYRSISAQWEEIDGAI